MKSGVISRFLASTGEGEVGCCLFPEMGTAERGTAERATALGAAPEFH